MRLKNNALTALLSLARTYGAGFHQFEAPAWKRIQPANLPAESPASGVAVVFHALPDRLTPAFPPSCIPRLHRYSLAMSFSRRVYRLRDSRCAYNRSKKRHWPRTSKGLQDKQFSLSYYKEHRWKCLVAVECAADNPSYP